MLKQDWSITKKISVAFFISLAVEVLQFVLAIGATDITDLIGVGIYTCMLKQDWSITKKISVAFFISLAVEVLQFVLAIGATDITDLIGNTIGGVIGIGVFYLFTRLFKNKTINILNILASISTVGLVSLISILLLVN